MGPTDRAPARHLAERPLLVAGRRLGGRYLLRRSLGHGGMAAVWLATDERLGRQVAIKVLSDTVAGDREFLDRFRREARVAAGLQHPNLVQVYDFDAGDRPYLVMEYIEGGTLAERFTDRDPPPAERLARELLSALRHIHSNGVLHRDVKPHNVLIDAAGHARLTDFGIAQPTDATALTEDGKVIGTESYMAPEVRAGEPASERSDLYSTGVLLAEAAREGASAALWSLIDQLRDELPSRRPASATAALAMLERAETPVVRSEPTEPFAPERPPPSGDRRRVLALAGLVAVLLALAGIALASFVSDDDGGGSGGDGRTAGAAEKPAGNDRPASAADQQAAAPTGEQNSNASPPVTTTEEPAPSGVELNNEGYDLIQAGDYDAAIPVLRRAVEALEGGLDQLTYGYALFNLAHALRLAGQPDEAIPLLEQRLQIPDQLPEVQAELAAAQAAGSGSGEGDGAVEADD